jgi:hypothetical protein
VECQEDTLRHKHFLDFLKSVVGKDPFERFTEQPYEIAYLIHPLYISVSVTGTMGESGDSFSSTSVFNFPIQMLNKALD